MRGAPSRVILLGPQAHDPDLGRVVSELGVEGPVALVSAGWQERESEDGGVRRLLGVDSVNLHLWARAERIWHEDRELGEAHGHLQQRVQALRRVYNVRLASALDAWITLLRTEGDPVVLEPERADALAMVRSLDRHHVERLDQLRLAFERDYEPARRAAVARQRAAVASILEDVQVVVIEGGHVPVLLNRLRLFEMGNLLARRIVVACSGGAMALAERVVFFHDSPPWGPGHPEVGEVGLGLVRGVIPLPHASARLRLGDPDRVRRLALRLAPDAAIVLDPGARLDWDGRWQPRASHWLSDSGQVVAWRGVA